MLARYTMERGRPASELPQGVRQDTRKHTRHCLRPTAELVEHYLSRPTRAAWSEFERDYLEIVEERYRKDRAPFDALAQAAKVTDVYLGCSCPTKKNPDVQHCHTTLALRFMKRRYPQLEVVLP